MDKIHTGVIMTITHKKIDAVDVRAAATRALAFWSTIDGRKLAAIGQNEKSMDIIGPEKKIHYARLA